MERQEGVCFARGFLAGSARAGIKPNGTKDDVALIYSTTPCTAAAVYTTNVVKAAPLQVTKAHLADGKAQAIVINSGNANAAANNGYEHAKSMTKCAANKLELDQEQVLVASTGVIGQELPIDIVNTGIEKIELKEDGSHEANVAIMTTDTREKSTELTFMVDGIECRMGGIAKGSGMIHPNMGTMLCFITTDCAIDSSMLAQALSACVKTTFNRISVDGDTSTNDMVITLANGQAHNPEIDCTGSGYDSFFQALHTVMETLAVDIARDGEGASRLLTVKVRGTDTEQKAETLARSVASSTLLKAAMFGKDANWGRVICAMGYSGAQFDPDDVDIAFAGKGQVLPVCKGGREVNFDEELASSILGEDAVDILIDLHEGDEKATCWGCDLTYEYVHINGDYRT